MEVDITTSNSKPSNSKINLELLSQIISDSLKYEVEKPKIGVYRPSLLPRCLLRQFNIYRYGVLISEEKAGIFKIGELFHSFLNSSLFSTEKVKVKAIEAPFIILVPFKREFIRIIGKADSIININQEDYIVEVKSIWKLPEKALKHHISQVMPYMAGYGLKKGFIIYLDKRALRHRIFAVEFDKKELERLIERAHRLHEALLKKNPPEPDAKTWEGRYCEFRRKCKRQHGSQRDYAYQPPSPHQKRDV